jgi:hypothetical protein
MVSSGMLLRVVLVRTIVSEERIASIIRVAKLVDSRNPDDGGETLLRYAGSYKSYTA